MAPAGAARWQVAGLAAALGLSERQLERHFECQFGVTPPRWLEGQRLRRARALLLAGHPLKTVAGRLGFADHAHFSHWFKKGTSLTPSAFRRLTVLPPPEPAAPRLTRWQNVAF